MAAKVGPAGGPCRGHGPGFLENAPDTCANDLATNIAAARRLLRACLRTAAGDDFECALAAMKVVPPPVRGALIARELDFAAELAAITVPVLVSHGLADTVVLPAMSGYVLEHGPTATASRYEEVGHAPFLQARTRFDAELAAFAREAPR
jgi:non-heme chloroperoxidase